MAIATKQHLDAMKKAVSEITALAPRLHSMTIDAMAVVGHNVSCGNLDGALAAQVTSIEYLAGEFDRLMCGFKKATADLLGERPRIGEDDLSFFTRISEAGPHGWPEMARKNGISFSLAGIGRVAEKRSARRAK